MTNKSLIIIALIAVFAAICPAAPSPAIVQGPDDWTLDVKYENPAQILVQLPDHKVPVRFWYIILSINNKSGFDADFYPKCELMTDTFQIIPAGKKVPDLVFNKIKLRHQGNYPFLEWVEKSDNKILQGEDNARDIAIIWPDFSPNAKAASFFITGLSNETAMINHPTKKDDNGQAVKIFLRKTLQLDYSIAGDPAFRSQAGLDFKAKQWIMR
ncbi:MAG: hypothetical protein ISS77_07370 [Phycisphaerae bacterium]|nr:hypothetical protein [Phycisphaerae bacterium]